MIFCWISSKRLQNYKHKNVIDPICTNNRHMGLFLFLKRGIHILTGKTHFTFGTAVTILMTHPTDWKSFLLCLGAGAVGACVSDVRCAARPAVTKGFNDFVATCSGSSGRCRTGFFFQAGIWINDYSREMACSQSGRICNFFGSLSLRGTPAAPQLYALSCRGCHAWYSRFYHAAAGGLVFCLWNGNTYFAGFVQSKKGAVIVSV